ncbi:MAG: hypothetical protein JXA64_10320 [Candidatus Fermentibacteraceae bacterium]|nr:hypothetical protein [Candidatus Fermentibacteraceae bacterium]MBN2609496.1 hypothetical protein [Candidatus Fermentibacteraceae bacterium]
MARWLPALSCLLLLSGTAQSFGYLSTMGEGTPLPGLNAVTMGLGGARAIGFGDALSILTNPAEIYRIPGTTMTLSLGPGVIHESFDDSTGYVSYNWVAVSSLSGAVKFQLSPRLAVGAGAAKISDVSFQGKYYERNSFSGEITESFELDCRGGLYESAAGFSWRPARWINVGLSGGLRFGGATCDSVYINRFAPEQDTTVSTEWDESRFCWHAGVMVPVGLTSFGMSWASGTDHYDSRIAAGAVLYTAESRQGALGIEAELVDPGGDGSLETRVLGQVSPSSSLTFRGSLSFLDLNGEVPSQGFGISVGTGVAFGRITLNGAYAWSSLTREEVSYSPYTPSNIKVSRSLLSVGVNWNL